MTYEARGIAKLGFVVTRKPASSLSHARKLAYAMRSHPRVEWVEWGKKGGGWRGSDEFFANFEKPRRR